MKVAAVIALYGLSIIGLLVLYAYASRSGIPFAELTRDPLAVCGGRFYYGVLSNLGILLWCAAATICLLTAAALRRTDRQSGFFLYSGLLTLVLLLDDLFQLHEAVLPAILAVRQRYILLSYLLLAGAYLACYHRQIFVRYHAFMAAALLFFSLSLTVDALEAPAAGIMTGSESALGSLLEDGSKLLGIISWLAFFASRAMGELEQWAKAQSH